MEIPYAVESQADPDRLEAAIAGVKDRLFVPHGGGQLEVLEDEHRFQTIAAGRRWGKTKVAARRCVRAALAADNQMVWWIANEYNNVRRGYREVVRQIPPSLLAKPAPVSTSNKLRLEFKTGSVIEFYSGGNPDGLAGEGVNFVVVDEGALIADTVWYQLIRPTLMDHKGSALIISTPRGKNWFWEMWNRGQSADPEYSSYRFPQSANPYIDPLETAAAKAELPELIYRQEIEAEFLAAGASIFGVGVERPGAVVSQLWTPRGTVYMGIDLAKQEDFTVITGIREEDRMPVFHERFNSISWPVQRRRIKLAIEDLEGTQGVTGVTALMDSTGLGDVVYDELTEDEVDVVPIKFNPTWKEQAVNLLAADLEQGKAFILEEQRSEFESYAFTITESGKYKYEASIGHDDEVAAKLLEHWGANHYGPPAVTILKDIKEDEREKPATIMQASEPSRPDSALDIMNNPDAWH